MSLRDNIGREHIEDGSPCWCLPTKWTLCPNCDGAEEGCFRCAGGEWLGLVPWNGVNDETMVVLHRSVEEVERATGEEG